MLYALIPIFSFMPKKSSSDMPIDLHISSVIKKRRKQLNLTQKYIAEQIGISIQQLQKYENGQNKVSTSKLIEFSKILKFNIKDLFIRYETSSNHALKEATLQESDNPFHLQAMDLFSRIKCHKTQKKIINMLILFLQEEDESLLEN
jgi:transcriptional regulator with XRE-family HTH domain